jgi:hypothetical protein
MTDPAWLEASTWYQETLYKKSDRIDRLRLLSNLPTFSVWRDIREELQAAADEIERLRKRVEELQEDGG